jgi:pimeloyl-ACP methyl ester carboxylesterase
MNINLVSADLSGAFQHADTVSAGVRFHYLFQGAGFPVILLSGFPESSYAWRKVIPQLASNLSRNRSRPTWPGRFRSPDRWL